MAMFAINAVSAMDNETLLAKQNFNDIQDMIDHANENDEIILNGTYSDVGQVNVNKTLTISGVNATLSASSHSTLSISAKNVVIRNISFVNGWSLKVTNSSSIISCSFKNNSHQSGSVIEAHANDNFSLNIIDCEFKNNKALTDDDSCGGAIRVISKDCRNSSLNIINSSFDSNSAVYGGAIYLYLDNSRFSTVIENCTFRKNSAFAGTIYIENGKENNNMKITNTGFKDNRLFTLKEFLKYCSSLEEYELILDDYNYYDFLLKGIDIAVGGYRHIFSEKLGFVLVNISDYNIEMTNSSIIHSAQSFVEGIESPIYSVAFDGIGFNCTDSLFINSSISSQGYDLDYNFTNTAFNGAFIDFEMFDIHRFDDPFDDSWINEDPAPFNFKTSCSGCVLKNSSVFVGIKMINNSTFIDSNIFDFNYLGEGLINCSGFYSTPCSFNNVAIDSSIFSKNSTIFIYNDTVIKNSVFDNNIGLSGSAICFGSKLFGDLDEQWDYDGQSVPVLTLNISNSIFSNNYARYEGGAVFCCSKFISLYIENSSFINNTARNGGAIYAFAKGGNVSYCVFDNNWALNTDKTVKYPKDYSGLGEDVISERDYYLNDNGFYGEKLYDKNTNFIGNRYYGNVFFGNITINDNFWGVNIDSPEEFIYYNLVDNISIPDSWVNIDDNFNFCLNNHSDINNMPDFIARGLNTTDNSTMAVLIKNGHGETVLNVANTFINKSTAKISITQNGTYYSQKTITLTLTDENNKPIANQELLMKFSGSKLISLKTDNNGKAVYAVLVDAGNYNVSVSGIGDTFKSFNNTLNNVDVEALPVKVDVLKFTSTYDSGKIYTIKVMNDNPVKGVKLSVKITKASKSKTYLLTSNANGIIQIKSLSLLDVGSYNVEITSTNNNFKLNTVKSSVKISKAKTIVKADKINVKFKKSKYFKINIKNKSNKKSVKNVKICVKIFTGKKYKTYTLKTDSNGIAKLNTKKLKIGKHNVIISSKNANYNISLKSRITVKK